MDFLQSTLDSQNLARYYAYAGKDVSATVTPFITTVVSFLYSLKNTWRYLDLSLLFGTPAPTRTPVLPPSATILAQPAVSGYFLAFVFCALVVVPVFGAALLVVARASAERRAYDLAATSTVATDAPDAVVPGVAERQYAPDATAVFGWIFELVVGPSIPFLIAALIIIPIIVAAAFVLLIRVADRNDADGDAPSPAQTSRDNATDRAREGDFITAPNGPPPRAPAPKAPKRKSPPPSPRRPRHVPVFDIFPADYATASSTFTLPPSEDVDTVAEPPRPLSDDTRSASAVTPPNATPSSATVSKLPVPAATRPLDTRLSFPKVRFKPKRKAVEPLALDNHSAAAASVPLVQGNQAQVTPPSSPGHDSGFSPSKARFRLKRKPTPTALAADEGGARDDFADADSASKDGDADSASSSAAEAEPPSPTPATPCPLDDSSAPSSSLVLLSEQSHKEASSSEDGETSQDGDATPAPVLEEPVASAMSDISAKPSSQDVASLMKFTDDATTSLAGHQLEKAEEICGTSALHVEEQAVLEPVQPSEIDIATEAERESTEAQTEPVDDAVDNGTATDADDQARQSNAELRQLNEARPVRSSWFKISNDVSAADDDFKPLTTALLRGKLGHKKRASTSSIDAQPVHWDSSGAVAPPDPPPTFTAMAKAVAELAKSSDILRPPSRASEISSRAASPEAPESLKGTFALTRQKLYTLQVPSPPRHYVEYYSNASWEPLKPPSTPTTSSSAPTPPTPRSPIAPRSPRRYWKPDVDEDKPRRSAWPIYPRTPSSAAPPTAGSTAS